MKPYKSVFKEAQIKKITSNEIKEIKEILKRNFNHIIKDEKEKDKVFEEIMFDYGVSINTIENIFKSMKNKR